MKATLKLFKALPIKSWEDIHYQVDEELTKRTIKMGFIFAPEILYHYSNYDELIDLVQDVYGITPEKLNNAFHKSWQKIKNTDIEQLVVEQIAHYLTTYGKESGEPELYLLEKETQWGVADLSTRVHQLEDIDMDRIMDKDYIYIPKEALDIPELEMDNIKLVVIKGYNKRQLKEKLLNLLNMGIALSEDTIQDVIDVALFVSIGEQDLATIRNKEVKATMYSYLDLVPLNPVEFLRLVVYKITGKTLLIKSSELITELKEAKDIHLIKLFELYRDLYGFERLAEIFYRFKPLFLALRTNRKLKTIVNKIRRLAVKHHKPMPEDYLNSITAKIKREEGIDYERLLSELGKVNTFRKIRLAYALKYRTKDVDSILYKIRNGKGYATEFSFDNKDDAQVILNDVLNSIVKDISKNVKDKKIYIPDNITYTLPATEKQFTGNFPSGSYITIPKDMVFGIHWENVGSNRIDLDLSVISKDIKIGWDSSYRTEDKGILFSGDITDATKPNGATELFYIKRQIKSALILLVNYFNFNAEVEVPFKIIVAKEEVKDFKQNYMVNPNNIFAVANSIIKQQQKILGLAITTTDECRFYFAETYIGNSITSFNSKFIEHCRKYLFNFYEHTIKLNNVLEMAGAKLVSNKERFDIGLDIDLSPESLEKDTILNLIK